MSMGWLRLRTTKPSAFGRRRWCSLRPSNSASATKRQALLPVDAVDPLDVAAVAFASQEHIDAPVAVVHASVRDLLEAQLQLFLALRFFSYRSFEQDMPTTRSTLRWLHPKRCINSGTNARRNEGLRLFLRPPACSIASSRLRSATICLSLRFASSSCRSRLRLGGPHPAVLLAPDVGRCVADAPPCGRPHRR